MHKLLRSALTSAPSPVRVSAAAWGKMRRIQEKTGDGAFLLAANAGGCGGMNYEFGSVSASTIAEMTRESRVPASLSKKDGLEVYVDPLSEMYLIGTTVDYIHEDYAKGIYESKFVFLPDKEVAGSCGCGESFYMKD